MLMHLPWKRWVDVDARITPSHASKNAYSSMTAAKSHCSLMRAMSKEFAPSKLSDFSSYAEKEILNT